MKIVYYSSHPYLSSRNPSGYGTHMREMMNAFRETGHEVIPFIVADKNSGETKTNSNVFGIIKKLLPRYFKESIKDFLLIRSDKNNQKELEELITKVSPDLIYERASCLQPSGVNAALSKSVKHILEINAPLAEEKELFFGTSLYSSAAKKTEKEILEKTSVIAVVSTALKNYFIKQYNIPASRFVVTPNAVNPINMKPDSEKVSQIISANKLTRKMVIGFTGSVFPWHGVDLLLDAFILAEKKFPDIVLLIVGDGVGMNELKSRSKKSGISQKIIFTGNVHHSEVCNYIETMHIAVMAKSNWYGSPVKIFEYGLLGKAIVAPLVAPVAEVMSDGTNGLLVQPSVNEISLALEKLISSSELREKLGTAFLKKVLGEHTWSINAGKILTGL